jgi:hypothetical protein
MPQQMRIRDASEFFQFSFEPGTQRLVGGDVL